jgi:hypothetical protein
MPNDDALMHDLQGSSNSQAEAEGNTEAEA